MTLNFKESCLTLLGISAVMVVGLFVVEMPIVTIMIAEAIFVGIIALARKIPYSDIQKSMVESVDTFVTPILMLLLIGALVASWITGGTVPTLIYIGLKVIDVRFFLIITFLICSLMSMLIGTSFGVMSTLGVAFMGISNGLGIEAAYTVSAIVSGAFLGDKMSPLSSSLALATELTSVEPTKGIRSTMRTNIPAFLLTAALYIYLGLSHVPNSEAHSEEAEILIKALGEEFSVGALPLIAPVLLIIFMAIKVPTIPMFSLGIIVGILESVLVQGYSLSEVSRGLLVGYDMSQNEMLNELLHYGGLNSMASTLILIIFTACFGGIIGRLGIMSCLLERAFRKAHTSSRVVSISVLLNIVCYYITGSYYTSNSILAPALNDIFDEYKVPREKLTTILLDTGTGLSPLVPWSASAIFIAATLGIEGIGYAVFSPILWLPVLLIPIYSFIKKDR